MQHLIWTSPLVAHIRIDQASLVGLEIIRDTPGYLSVVKLIHTFGVVWEVIFTSLCEQTDMVDALRELPRGVSLVSISSSFTMGEWTADGCPILTETCFRFYDPEIV